MPEWTAERLASELKDNGCVPGKSIIRRVNRTLTDLGKFHRIITRQRSVLYNGNRFYLVLVKQGLFCVMEAPEAGTWVVITVWKYR
jgi:hypothetical protein